MKKGRDSKGRFLKKGGSRSRRAHAGRKRHPVKGYTQHRGRKVVHVHRHESYEPRTAKRRTRRARAGRSRKRRSRGGGGGHRPVIVVANRPRRHGRHGRARMAGVPPMMTWGGMAVFGLGLLAGYEGANMLGRYMVGMDPSASTTTTSAAGTSTSTLPSGITTVAQYNELVQAAPPSLKKTGYEMIFAVVGFALGIFAKSPLLKLLGYGVGFGGLVHIVCELLDGYVIRPMFVTAPAAGAAAGTAPTLSNAGQRMYQHEQTAANAKAAAAAVAGSASLGAPPASRAGTRVPPQTRQLPAVPVMLAPQLGAPPFAGGLAAQPQQSLTAGQPTAVQTYRLGDQGGGAPPPVNQQQPAPPPGQAQPMPPPNTTGAVPPPGTQLGNQPPAPGGVLPANPTPPASLMTPCAPSCGEPPADEPARELRTVPMQAAARSRMAAFNAPLPRPQRAA